MDGQDSFVELVRNHEWARVVAISLLGIVLAVGVAECVAFILKLVAKFWSWCYETVALGLGWKTRYFYKRMYDFYWKENKELEADLQAANQRILELQRMLAEKGAEIDRKAGKSTQLDS